MALGLAAAASCLAASPQMSIPGEFSVTPTGAAAYEIPIKVAPGVAGMEPKLSLTYNSRAPDGLVGVGWSLNGIPAITRCPRTVPQDSIKGSVTYSATTDRFCLDSRRLMVVSGTYGADASVYRTELDTMAQVTAHGTTGYGPSYFTVQTKDGRTYEYGYTTDSRVMVNGLASAVRLWSLDKVSDPLGNTMTVTYTEPAAGSFYPSQISYTANPGAGVAATNAVVFGYDTARPDPVQGWQGGHPYQVAWRLSSVTIKSGGVAGSVYSLKYDNATTAPYHPLSHLVQVSLCSAAQAGPCLSPTVITVGQNANPYGGIRLNQLIEGSPESGLWFPLDLNNDGKTDLVHIVSMSAADYRTWISNGDGTFKISEFNPTDDTGNLATTGIWQSLDLDGNGLADLVHLKDSNGNYVLWVNNGNNTFTRYSIKNPVDAAISTGFWMPMDIDGNGISDFVHIATNGSMYIWTSLGINGFSTLKYTPTGDSNLFSGTWQVLDVNGDGLPDLVHMTTASGDMRVWVNNGAGGFTVKQFTNGIDTSLYTGTWQVLDVNGDGLADLVHMTTTSATMKVWISKGDGTFAISTFTANAGNGPNDTFLASGSWQVADVDGDGLPDLVHTSANLTTSPNYWTWRSNGDGTFVVLGYEQDVDNCLSGCTNMRAGDFGGNGMPGFVRIGTASVASTWMLSAAPLQATSITNGLGGKTSWTTNTLPAMLGTTYTMSPGGTTGLTIVPSMSVVSYATSNLGSAGLNNFGMDHEVIYAYDSARTQVNGRGFEGFAWVQATDLVTGQQSRTTYNQTFPFTGMAATVSRGTGAGSGTTLGSSPWSNLSATTYTYGCKDMAQVTTICYYPSYKVYYPYVASAVTQLHDLDGTALPGLQVQSTNLDLYGNVGTTTTTLLNPDQTASAYSKVVQNTYWNDTANWRLGKLLETVTSATGPDVPAPVMPGSGHLPAAPVLSPPISVASDGASALSAVAGGTAASGVVTFLNGGGQSVTLTMSGLSAPYSVSPTSCTAAAGAKCSVTVSMATSGTPGVQPTQTLTATSSLGGNAKATVAGTLTGAPITVQSDGAAALSAAYGAAPATGAVTFLNGGTQSVTLTMSGLSAPYSVSPTSCTAAAGGTCTVTVSMATTLGYGAQPTQTLKATASIGGSATATVAGTISGGAVSLQTDGASALSASYGAVTATGVVTFANASNQAATLSFSGISAPYSLSASSCSLPAAGTCSVTVSMATSTIGSQATQTLTANGGVGSATARVSGTVLGSKVALTSDGASALSATRGSTAASGAVTFTNSGNQAASLTFGGLSGAYSVSPATCTAAVGGSCTTTVTMATSGPLGTQGTQTLTASGGSTGAATASVSGTLLGSSVSVQSDGASALNATLGGAAATGSVVFVNNGNQPATLSMSGLSAPYSVSPTSCTAAAGGGLCTVTVSMSAAALGTMPAQTLTATGATNGAVTAAVGGSVNGSVLSTSSSATFITVYAGSSGSWLNLTATNVGNQPMTLTVSGFSGPYSLASNDCNSVAPGASCTIVISESTATAGSFSDTITLSGATSPSSWPLTMTGQVLPTSALSISPAVTSVSASRGTIRSSSTITVTNTGPGVVSGLTLSLAKTAGPSDVEMDINPTSCTGAALNSGGSCTLTTSFSSSCISNASSSWTLRVSGFGAANVATATINGLTTGTVCN